MSARSLDTTLKSSRRSFLLSATGLAGINIVSFAGPTDPVPDVVNPGRVKDVEPEPAGTGSTERSTALAPPDRQPADLKLPEMPVKKIGWAIVGLGDLALGEILPAFAECKYSKPVALVSGHPDKAKRVAAAYNISEEDIYNYENYDKLAENKKVDVIYIVLPNSMHAEYTIRGLKAGKHVLCEKPMAASVQEAEQMIAASKEAGKELMIAYRLHYEPFNQKAMELCREGKLGKIKTFVSTNGQDVKAPNIRLSGKLAGGPVGDVGVYSINAARYTLGEEPVEVFAVATQPKDDPRFAEVPESVAFTLKYPSGVIAHCDSSFGMSESRFYQVHGTKGSLRMDPAFSYRGLRLHLKAKDPESGETEASELLLKAANHFAEEMDHFSAVVANGETCKTPGSMGLADMRILAAIEQSWKSGRPVKLSEV